MYREVTISITLDEPELMTCIHYLNLASAKIQSNDARSREDLSSLGRLNGALCFAAFKAGFDPDGIHTNMERGGV